MKPNSNYCPYALYKLQVGKKPYTYCRELKGECCYLVKENCDTREKKLNHLKLTGLAKLLSMLELK